MEYDYLVEVIKKHHAAIRFFKKEKCLCLSPRPVNPKLFHFTLYKTDDSIVVYCDRCINSAKKGALREFDEKEYFVVQITDN